MYAHDNIVPLTGKGAHPSKATAESVIAETASLTGKYLNPLMKALFDKADTTLFEMADKSDNNTQQAHYLDTMRELRLVRADIESRFNQTIARAFEQALVPGSVAADEIPAFDFDADSLSLVEDDNLEESLAIKGMVEKLKNQQQRQLDALDRRFNHLLKGIRGEGADYPVSPESLCNAFHDATRAMDLELPVKLVIYKLFDLNVVAHLGPFYEAINELMVRAGVLPRLPKPWKKQVESGNAPARRTPEQPSYGIEGGAIGEPLYTAGDSEPETALLNALHAMLAGPVGSGLIPIQPGAQIGQGGSISPIKPAQLLSSLTGLQQQAGMVSDRAIDGASLKGMLATSLQGDNGSQLVGFQQRESLIIDVVAMLFDFILEDSAIPDVAKAQIARLQIPMVKAALMDDSFLAKRTHPAKQLLNRMAQASSALDRSVDRESPLLNEITRIAGVISNEFEDDIAIFERELHALDAFVEEQEQDEQQVSEIITSAKSRQEDAERLKGRVDEAIRIKLAMSEVPEPIKQIINHTWRQVLLHTGRVHGADSELWNERTELIAMLLDSLQDSEEKEKRRKLLQAIPGIVATIRRGMADAGYDDAAIQQVLKVIEPLHVAIITPAKSDGESTEEALKQRAIENAINDMQEEMRHLDQMLENLDGSLLEPEPLGEDIRSIIPDELIEEIVLATEEFMAPEDLPDDEYISTIRDMPIGQLVILYDRDNNPVRGKLSWKSELLGEYVFTNWRHKVVAERTLHGLAGELYQGRLKLLEHGNILDRAMEKVVGGIRQIQSGAGPIPDGLPA